MQAALQAQFKNQAEACKQAQADMERMQKEFRAKAEDVAAVKKRKLEEGVAKAGGAENAGKNENGGNVDTFAVGPCAAASSYGAAKWGWQGRRRRRSHGHRKG